MAKGPKKTRSPTKESILIAIPKAKTNPETKKITNLLFFTLMLFKNRKRPEKDKRIDVTV